MDTAQLEREYREQRRPLYEGLCSRIAELVGQFVKDAGIPVAQIENRVKTVESFVSKIERKSYKDPFSEIKDFAGIRVVCYYNADVTRVAELLRNEFEVDDDHSSDKVADLAVDEFGYRSFHLACSINDPRASLSEWKALASLQFEVQVRSVLQHAWAAISHKLDYKTASQAPRDIRRQLFRLSALLELADDQFTSIRDVSEGIVADYRVDVEKGKLSIPLDLDSLTEYVREKVDLEHWEQLAIDCGFVAVARKGDEQSGKEGVQVFFTALQAIGLTDIAEVDAAIQRHTRSAQQILKRVAIASKKHGFLMRADPVHVLTVFLAVAERQKFPKGYSWPKPWRDELRAAMDELLAPKADSASRKKGAKAQQLDSGDA